MTATIQANYDLMCQRTEQDHEIASLAHTLYANQRAMHRNMVPWRNANRVVKREFVREAKQMLGLA